MHMAVVRSCSLHIAVPILCSGPPVVGEFHLAVYNFSLTVTFLVSIYLVYSLFKTIVMILSTVTIYIYTVTFTHNRGIYNQESTHFLNSFVSHTNLHIFILNTPNCSIESLTQRRLVTLFTLLHARRCANHAIHGRFNPVQPAESADHNLRTSKTIRTDVIRNVRLITIQ